MDAEIYEAVVMIGFFFMIAVSIKGWPSLVTINHYHKGE
jgi:hypothetical protein